MQLAGFQYQTRAKASMVLAAIYQAGPHVSTIDIHQAS